MLHADNTEVVHSSTVAESPTVGGSAMIIDVVVPTVLHDKSISALELPSVIEVLVCEDSFSGLGYHKERYSFTVTNGSTKVDYLYDSLFLWCDGEHIRRMTRMYELVLHSTHVRLLSKDLMVISFFHYCTLVSVIQQDVSWLIGTF
jgi:hypothetical protein